MSYLESCTDLVWSCFTICSSPASPFLSLTCLGFNDTIVIINDVLWGHCFCVLVGGVGSVSSLALSLSPEKGRDPRCVLKLSRWRFHKLWTVAETEIDGMNLEFETLSRHGFQMWPGHLTSCVDLGESEKSREHLFPHPWSGDNDYLPSERKYVKK